MAVINKLHLLENDKLYNKIEIIKTLHMSARTFYKYFVDEFDIQPDESLTSRRHLYKGSTVNEIIRKMNDSKTIPYYIDEE